MARLNHRARERRAALFMSLPALLGLGVFVALPLILGVYWSLTDKRLISPLPTQFIGLENYNQLLGLNVITLEPETDEATGRPAIDEAGNFVYPRVRTLVREDERYEDFREWFTFDAFGERRVVLAKDPAFMRALINTFVFVALIVPGQGGLALILALLVNQRLRGINFFRTAYFTPIVTSMAVIAIVWTFLYNPDRGLINRFLEVVTFGAVGNIPWLISTDTALLAIVILSIWHSVGLQMVIFLAGLQGIPDVLNEAAKIDGAGSVQRFRFVTVPQLRNTLIFVIISTTILAFRVFTQIDVMTRGGPENATRSVVYHAVDQGFRQQQIGYGSAITIVFFVTVLLIALIQRRLLPTERPVGT